MSKTPKVTKAAASTATVEAPAKNRGPSSLQLAALKLLDKGASLSRAEISAKLDDSFIGGKVMGHVDPAKLRATSLIGRGLVKFDGPAEEGGAIRYKITPAGKKALATAAKAPSPTKSAKAK